MIKIFLVFVAILPFNILIYSQGLQQTVKSWPLGEKMKVEHLNEDLEVVKEEYFDPNGIKVASYLIDPVTKKYNGPFFDGTNKGTYNQGILTADNFRVFLIDGSTWYNQESEITINIKEGITYGKAIKITYDGPIFSTKIYSAEFGDIAGYNFIRYENYINKKHQEFLKERNIKEKYYFSMKYELNYDQNGLLHGDHFIDPNITMIFDHGECLGIMTYDGITGINEFDDNHNFIGVKGYALDSVFRDQKVWKRNFKLIKNCGFIEGYTLPNIYNVDQLRLLSFNAYDYGGVDEKKIFTGQEVFAGLNYPKLTFFNSDVSIAPNHFKSRWIDTKRNEFLFEFRTASLNKYGFYVSDLSPLLSVFTPQKEYGENIFNYHIDTIEHIKIIFALQNLHCTSISYGKTYFDDINFHKDRIFRRGVPESYLITDCQGCTNYFEYDRSVSKSRWIDDELMNNCDNWVNIGYFDQTGYFVLEELHNKTKQKTRADEIAIKFYFIKKDLKKESDSRDEAEKIGLYSFDDVIDFSAIQEKNKEIIENYEKEKQATKLKIDQICLNLTSGIESENWKVLIDLSKELDRQIALNEKMGYDLSFEDPRTAFLKGGKQDFSAYVNEQIEKQKIRAEYKELKEGLEQISSKLNLKFETNIPTDGDLIELFNRLSIKNKSLPQFLNDVERRLDKMLISVRENFDGTDQIAFKAVFFDEQKDAGPLHFVLYFNVGKPKNDFLMDKKSLKQEWKLNTPKLIFQFSTENINRIAYIYGNIRFGFEYNQL